MEGRPQNVSSHRSPRPVKPSKRDISPPVSKVTNYGGSKSVRLQEPHKRRKQEKREDTMEKVEEEEVKETSVMPGCTVVNVDSVREKTKEEKEELLGLLETEWQEAALKPRNLGLCELLLTVIVLAAVIFFFPLSIWFCVKVVREYERAVVFRLGHLLQRKPSGPGLLFYLPFVDACQKIDIRLKTLQVPSHAVVTKDLVCTDISVVCYYRIENVSLCYTSLASVPTVLQAMAQVLDREVLARHTFTQLLLDRKKITREIQVALDSIAGRWGIKVDRADIEDLRLPSELQHNFAMEAEAKRQAQLKVIAAEGERAACEALRASVDSLSGSPLALQLRMLQLLQCLRSERPAVVVTLPPDLLGQPLDLSASAAAPSQNSVLSDTSNAVKQDSPMM